MANVVDIERLLVEISPEAPCGEDLEYDAAFGELERTAESKPEQQFGDTIVPAEDPDWREVRSQALDLLQRTKDLRVAQLATRALTHIDGYPGLRDALALIHGYLDRYWENVYPLLDPDDDNDPTERVNCIAALSDQATTLNDIRRAPLVSSRALGSFGLRDVAIATGDHPPPANHEGPLPDMATIEAAFTDVGASANEEMLAVVNDTIEHLDAIETTLTDRVGAARALDLGDLRDVLHDARKLVAARVGETAGGEDEGPDGAASDEEPNAIAGGAEAPARAISGDFRSRDDIARMLDRACAYLERHEPTSPVPLLLKRAKRLLDKNFIDLLQDLAPEGVSQAENVLGSGEGD